MCSEQETQIAAYWPEPAVPPSRLPLPCPGAQRGPACPSPALLTPDACQGVLASGLPVGTPSGAAGDQN